MDWNHLKIETDLAEKSSTEDKLEDPLQLVQSPGIKIPSKKSRNHIHPRKLMRIAQDYVDLYAHEVGHHSPFRKVLGFPIIQCPSCLIPRNARGRIAFLDMLIHVRKRHPSNCNFLFSQICDSYKCLIARMRRTVDSQRVTKYCFRPRITEPERNISGD